MPSVSAAEAVFASSLQPSDHPTPAQVRSAIQASLRTHHGVCGCAAVCATEYGAHPETAAARMRWALSVAYAAAKAAVFALLIFVVGELTAFPTFFLGAAILHSRAPVSITDPGVLRAIIGAGMYLAVLAAFAIAIGALVRHTAGAITGIIGFVLVLSPLTQLIPGSVGNHIHDYLPSEAGSLIASPRQGIDDLLGPWQGFGVLYVETAVLMVAAAYLLRRRDA